MKVREMMYQHNLLSSYRFEIPIISVGNLVLGGTGKTPTVIYLCNLLKAKGFHPAVISRGYRGTAGSPVNIVSDGHTIFLDSKQAGDEPFLIASIQNDVPVLTGRKRKTPCHYAIHEFPVDVLILDDGFQHLSVQRDIDIVLFDGTTLGGKNRIFPAGILRESYTALHRCTALLFTGVSEKNIYSTTKFAESVSKRFKKPYFISHVLPGKIVGPKKIEGLTDKDRSEFFAFAGIANPERFFESLSIHAIHPKGFLALPDHAQYSEQMLSTIYQQARDCGAKHFITTQKDLVKIQAFNSPLPLYVLELSLSIESAFTEYILNSLKNLSR